ncbi:MAG: hypothetical protein KKF56_02045 [Nanoarchaeota archaeon]|nr:hypothetical protein [Nanoarchaeota archaeon]
MISVNLYKTPGLEKELVLVIGDRPNSNNNPEYTGVYTGVGGCKSFQELADYFYERNKPELRLGINGRVSLFYPFEKLEDIIGDNSFLFVRFQNPVLTLKKNKLEVA